MKRKHLIKNKIKNNNAITLIALVVTIIALLILSGISITFIVRGNIMEKAQEAKEKTNLSNYDAALQTLGVSKKAEKILQGLSTKEYMSRYKQAVEEEPLLKGVKVEFKDSEETSFRVYTKEGYMFDVYENGVIYAGKDE